ncbi:MAG: four helix bundle protein [bacterium]
MRQGILTILPPPPLLPLLAKAKSCYLVWISFYEALPKIHKYTLGQKIDTLFIEVIEAISIATFLAREEKQPWIRLAIRKTDTLKILLMVLWEAKSIDNKKYINLSVKVEEIGRMLGGWSGQIAKQNSPAIQTREK